MTAPATTPPQTGKLVPPAPPAYELIADIGDGFEVWAVTRPPARGWTCVRIWSRRPRRKRSHWTAWNGERLARSSDLGRLLQFHPDVVRAAVDALRQRRPTAPLEADSQPGIVRAAEAVRDTHSADGYGGQRRGRAGLRARRATSRPRGPGVEALALAPRSARVPRTNERDRLRVAAACAGHRERPRGCSPMTAPSTTPPPV